MTMAIQSTHDIDLELHGKIKVSWKCPRCGHKNTRKGQVSDLLGGSDLDCGNVAVCGRHNAVIELSLDLFGYYKDHNDISLGSIKS